MRMWFYLLNHSLWLLNHLLKCFLQLLPFSNFLFIDAVLLLISTWFYSNPRGKFKFSEQAKTSLKYLFLRQGLSNLFIMVKLLQTNQYFLILIPPNKKLILTNFDGFDHNYGSICVFPWPRFFGNILLLNGEDVLGRRKIKTGPSKWRWGYRKQIRWDNLTINTVA